MTTPLDEKITIGRFARTNKRQFSYFKKEDVAQTIKEAKKELKDNCDRNDGYVDIAFVNKTFAKHFGSLAGEETKCVLSRNNKCHSDYNYGKNCNGIELPNGCPYEVNKIKELK